MIESLMRKLGELEKRVEDLETQGYSIHRMKATTATAQSFTSGAYTTVQYETEVYDDSSCYNTATYQYTAPASGVYLITAAVYMATPTLVLGINKNGTTAPTDDIIVGAGTNLSSQMLLTAGDTIEIMARQSSGGPLSLSADARGNFFEVCFLG